MTEAFLAILAINVIAAIGMNLVYVSGQLNLGQAGFVAVGAYAAALTDVWLGWPLPLSLLAGAVAAALVALPVAIGAARLHGVYLIMGTLAVGELVRITLGNLDAVGGLQGFAGHAPVTASTIYTVMVVAAVAALALMSSPLGLKMRSVFDDEEAAAAAGVSTRPVKIFAVVISAAVVGVAGGLLAKWFLFIAPRNFGIELSFRIALFSLVGGVHSLIGAAAGAIGITSLLEGLRNIEDAPLIGDMLGGLARWRLAIYGALVVLLMGRLPEGLVSRRMALTVTKPMRNLRRQIQRRRRNSRKAKQRAGAVRPLTPDAPVLEVKGLAHSFGSVQALSGVSMAVQPGEAVALIGANGAGKTTLVNLVAGRLASERGTIWFGGEDVSRMPAHRRTRAGIARTFQSVRVFSHLTVEETIRLGAWAGRDRTNTPMEKLLASLGLSHLRDALPDQLSLADQRRLEIGRALASAPEIVLLDEPSAGMNDDERRELATLIKSIAGEGTAVVLVDHNLDLAFEIGQRVIVFDFGRVIATGTPSEIMADPRVHDAYLGVDPEPEE